METKSASRSVADQRSKWVVPALLGAFGLAYAAAGVALYVLVRAIF